MITKFLKANKIRRLRQPYEWKNVGVPRAGFNKGTVTSVFDAYFNMFQACPLLRSLTRLLPYLEPANFVKVCSYVNSSVKLYLSHLPVSNWKHLIDLAALVGYPKVEDRIFKDDLKNWLVGPKYSGYRVDYLRVFKNIVTYVGKKAPFYGSFNEYLFARYTWMNSGSSNLSKLVVEGERVKTKFGAALSLTDTELVKAVARDKIHKEGLRAFVKPDEKGPKGRYIVSASLGLYIKQKYLFDKLRNCTSFDRRMVAYIDPVDKYNMFDEALGKYEWFIPLDEAKFDYNVTTDQWLAFFDLLRAYLPEDVEIIDEIASYLGTLALYDSEGKKIGTWGHGMPSGFYWTAFGDTLFNLTKQLLLQESDPDYIPLAASGDDSNIVCLKMPDLAFVEQHYAKHCAEVEKSKNWVGYKKFEFLKVVVEEDRTVSQYPARSFASLAWMYPDFRNSTPATKMRTTAELWKDFFDRRGKYDYKMMIADVFRSISKDWRRKLRLNLGFIEEWLFTIPALGGFGLLPARSRMRFRFRATNIPQRAFYNRSNYPLMYSKFVGIYCEKLPRLAKLTASRGRTHSREYYIGRLPTWRQFVAYTRATYGLPNYLGLRLGAQDQHNSWINPQFFSPLYISARWGSSPSRGLISDLDEMLSDIVRSLTTAPKPSLWK